MPRSTRGTKILCPENSPTNSIGQHTKHVLGTRPGIHCHSSPVSLSSRSRRSKRGWLFGYRLVSHTSCPCAHCPDRRMDFSNPGSNCSRNESSGHGANQGMALERLVTLLKSNDSFACRSRYASSGSATFEEAGTAPSWVFQSPRDVSTWLEVSEWNTHASDLLKAAVAPSLPNL